MTKALSLLLVLAAGLNSCIGNLLLKWSRAATPVDASAIEKLSHIGFIGGLGFYAINVVLFAKALDAMEVSIAYPILAGSGFAMLAAASWYLFDEPFTLVKGVGLSLVLAGIVLLAQRG
jgi:multidrug transporter EmrE-like cation transporter